MSTIPTSSSVAPYPFKLCFLSGSISVCSGCMRKYLKPAIPPYDIVDQRGFGNAYYHATPYCIQAKWPLFQADELQIPTEVFEGLLDEHKWFINQTFGLVFP